MDSQWVNAVFLPENAVLSSRVGEEVFLKEKSFGVKNSFVYNFTVKDNHTYYAGESSVLVHNAKSKKCGRLAERAVSTGSYEAARNRALKELGVIDNATRTPTYFKSLGDSKIPSGLVSGFNTNVGGVWKQFRVDFDENGPHINVKVGKGSAMVTNLRIDFPGTEADVHKFLKTLSR